MDGKSSKLKETIKEGTVHYQEKRKQVSKKQGKNNRLFSF
jgi:hypothetical protein